MFFCFIGWFFKYRGDLFSNYRIFRHCFTFLRLILTSSNGVEGKFNVNMTRLFLRFYAIKVSFATCSNLSYFNCSQRAMNHFNYSGISGGGVDSRGHLFQVRFRLIRCIGSAINARECSGATCSQRARGAHGVIVASTANGTSGLGIRDLCFGGTSNMMVRAAYRYRIGLRFILRIRSFRYIGGGFTFFGAFRSYLAVNRRFLRSDWLFFIHTAWASSKLWSNCNFFYGSINGRFNVCIIRSSFIRFICNGNSICGLVYYAGRLNGTNRGFSVVRFSAGASTGFARCDIGSLRWLCLIRREITSRRVNVTLVGFTVTSFLQAIDAPCKLCLVTFRQRNRLFAILCGMTNGECNRVVARPFFTWTNDRFVKNLAWFV